MNKITKRLKLRQYLRAGKLARRSTRVSAPKTRNVLNLTPKRVAVKRENHE